MSERLHAEVSAGVCIPGFMPRLATALLGAAGALALVPAPFCYLAAVFAVAGAVFPVSLGTWGCALVLALAQLARTPQVADWHPYAVLALVHLLHVVGAWSTVVEPEGALQVRALARPLLRWFVIQLPAQAVLALVLWLSATGGADARATLAMPGLFALVAAACVGGIVLLILRRR